MHCPQCGLEQPDANECRRCGVIFSRLSKRRGPGTATAPARLPAEKKQRRRFFFAIRITLLLALLLGLCLNILLTRSRVARWERSLWVVIHPICADDSPATRRYVDALTPEAFAPVADFFSAGARQYGLKLQDPFTIVVEPRLDALPPQVPADPTPLAMILWSVKLRWWAGRVPAPGAPLQDIQLFVLYYDPARTVLEHSLAMPKGYIGIVHAYAARKLQDTNAVVIAHELLHLAGATDKYDPATELPLYPDGYADPEARPRYAQTRAEIMAGSIPLSPARAAMPGSLAETVIGPATAREINWAPAE